MATEKEEVTHAFKEDIVFTVIRNEDFGAPSRQVGAVGVQFFYSFGCRGSGFAGFGMIMGQFGAVGVQFFYSIAPRSGIGPVV